MMHIRLLSVLLAASACCCAMALTPFENTANQYIDMVLQNLGPHLKDNNLDPLPIEDMVFGFSKKVLLITVHGSIGVTNGRMYGISTLHRTGDCQLQTEGNNRLIVDAKVGVKDMWGAFNGHAKFMGVGLDVKLSVAVDLVTVDARIVATLGDGSAPDLPRFAISSISKITIRFSGLSVLDWIINPVTNLMVNALKGILVKVIEVVVRAQVKKVLANIKLPFEQLP